MFAGICVLYYGYIYMQLLKYTILGIIQGLTEFLPVSSSGHLVIFQTLFGFETPPVFFDILLHLATLIAVVFFVRRELWRIIINIFKPKTLEFRLFILLVIASVPTAVIGILFNEWIESLFSSVKIVGAMLLVTGVMLFLTNKKNICSGIKNVGQVRIIDAIMIGIAQGMAVMPGISRSGFTISTGLFCRLERELAAKFSFILAIPAILGATVFKFKEGIAEIQTDWLLMLPGFILAMVVGFLSLGLLLKIIKEWKLYYFSYYCWLIGIIVLVVG